MRFLTWRSPDVSLYFETDSCENRRERMSETNSGAASHSTRLSSLFVFAFTVKVTGVMLCNYVVFEAFVLTYFRPYDLFVLVRIQPERAASRQPGAEVRDCSALS